MNILSKRSCPHPSFIQSKTSLISGWFLFIILFLISTKINAQTFGGNPPSLEWKQINNAQSRVIFPAGLDSTAMRVSNIISAMDDDESQKTRKINILLQNQNTVSNGYVGLGPFRSEFYLTPPQNSFSLGSLPWADQLTIHEYRHAVQYNQFNTGISKVMRTIFGEHGQALANSAAVPDWFFEGDAVYAETNFSKQGRGSLPYFYKEYRALWNANKNYSWMKLRNGSLKDAIPNHYPTGFMLVAYGYEKYGNDFWKNVTTDAASFKKLFYPFQQAIKKHSGQDFTSFRKDAFDFFKQQFKEDDKDRTLIYESFRDEQYPVFTEDGRLIYVESSYKKTPRLVMQTATGTKTIRKLDNIIEPYFSYNKGKIVYASYQPDVRWGYKTYNNIVMADATNGHQHTITKKTKYFSPALSGDGKMIVAVNVPPSGKNSLHLLDAENGTIIDSIKNPEQLFYTYPKLHIDHILSPVRNHEGKMSLAWINTKDYSTEYLVPFSFNVIAFPLIQNDTLYFSYSYQKNDELFAYTFSDKKLWIINSPVTQGIGKYQVAADEENLVWSSLTANGYRLQKARKSTIIFEEINTATMGKNTSGFGINSLNNIHSNLLNKVADEERGITKYPKSFRLFNFHSLQPAIDDPQYTLTLLSENILNTLRSDISFTYDRAEKFKRIGFGATYGALFPHLSAGVNYTFDRKIFSNGRPVYFNQIEPYAGFSIPLNFSRSRSFTHLTAGSQFVYNQSNFQGVYKDSFNTVSYSYLNNFINFSNQALKSRQQIFPHFAQSVSLSYKNTLGSIDGSQVMANGSFYFPALLNNHSLVINGAYMQKDSLKEISFSSGFPFSRGYGSANFYRMKKWGVNYHFPLFYPDAGFGNIAYLLRVRGNIFYDDTRVEDFFTNGNNFNASFRSVGTEVYFDTKWWNQVALNFGIRYSHLLDADLYGNSGTHRWEFILPVNIFNN